MSQDQVDGSAMEFDRFPRRSDQLPGRHDHRAVLHLSDPGAINLRPIRAAGAGAQWEHQNRTEKQVAHGHAHAYRSIDPALDALSHWTGPHRASKSMPIRIAWRSNPRSSRS
jgi:hypothetical protein